MILPYRNHYIGQILRSSSVVAVPESIPVNDSNTMLVPPRQRDSLFFFLNDYD